MQDVGPGAAVEQIVAVTAIEVVIAVAAVKIVVAFAAIGVVVAFAAIKIIAAVTAQIIVIINAGTLSEQVGEVFDCIEKVEGCHDTCPVQLVSVDRPPVRQ